MHGHEHADGRIRRVALAGTPQEGEIADVKMVLKELAYSRLRGIDATLSPEYGRSGVGEAIIQATDDFATITPVVLPNPELRGRHGELWRNRQNLSPAEKLRIENLRKAGQQRLVRRLLEDAGLHPLEIAVQNASFSRRVPSASAFQIPDARQPYLKNTRVHVRIKLAMPSVSPIALGPGKFFGLGLLVPMRALKGATTCP
jgi:CRISPR-associated protein Csb2